jgi:hypothetical protein
MKTPKKSKSPPATKPVDNQLTLDMLDARLDHLASVVEASVERLDTALLSIRQQLDEHAYTQALTPAEPKRPTLKWYEQEPKKIYWRITVDPATLVLIPGTTLRYNVAERNISTYDGVVIGGLGACDHQMLSAAWSVGTKLHVYLTSSRKLGIKLGRPA